MGTDSRSRQLHEEVLEGVLQPCLVLPAAPALQLSAQCSRLWDSAVCSEVLQLRDVTCVLQMCFSIPDCWDTWLIDSVPRHLSTVCTSCS